MSKREFEFKFSNRQLATMLAALRYWQKKFEAGGLASEPEMRMVATESGVVAPLSSTEIDILCEELNK